MSNPANAAYGVQTLQSPNQNIWSMDTDVRMLSNDLTGKSVESSNTGDWANSVKKQQTPVQEEALQATMMVAAAKSQKKFVNAAIFENDSSAPSHKAFRSIIIRPHFVLLWILIAYFSTFVSSRLIYNFALNDNDKHRFDMLAKYLYEIPSNLNTIWFLGVVINQIFIRRSMATTQDVLPGTSQTIELFERTLKKDMPERAERVKQFSRYVLLMWLTTAREFSKPLKQQYQDWSTIQETLGLQEVETKALERKENNGELLSVVTYTWIKAIVAEMDEKGYFKNPGNASEIYQNVFRLKKKCSLALKYSNRLVVPKFFLLTCWVVIHFYGWLSVLGVQLELQSEISQKFYFPSQYALAYFLSCFAFSVGRTVIHPFDDNEDCNMVRTFQEKVESCKRFLSVYNNKYDDMFD